MTDTFAFDGVIYDWRARHTLTTLYGKNVIPESCVPHGLLMVVVNEMGDALRVRGECVKGEIRFTPVVGEHCIGAWVPRADTDDRAYVPTSVLAPAMARVDEWMF